MGRTDSRPLGITLLCAFYAILTPIMLFVLFELYVMVPDVYASNAELAMIRAVVGLIAIGITVYGIAFYAALYGLWTMKLWGWRLALVVFGLSAVFSLVQGELLGVVIAVGFTLYLYSTGSHYGHASSA